MASYTEQQQISETPATGSGNVARLVDRLSKDISTLQKGVPIKPPKPGNNNSRIATVRFSYAAQQEDELTLLEDDVIEVMEDVEDGWARGKLKDKIGMFPTNFVSFSTATTTNTTTYSGLSRVNEESRKKSTEESSTTTNGKASVEKTSSSSSSYGNNVLPSTFKASVRNKNGPSATNNTTPTASLANKSVKEYAKVLYEYKAINPDELDLNEGDIVTIINKKCADEGWCLGELNGLFPENFVRISPVGSGPPPSSTMPTNGSTAPPVLPAKPLKPASGFGSNKSDTANAFSATTPTSPSAISNAPTDSSALGAAHKPLEERKSVVAGIQSKLFPQGKMPPRKPTFQPSSNVLTSSQHSSRGDSDSTPTIMMRHSVVDPTKIISSAGQFEDQQHPENDKFGEEPMQLESLTKFRPKQPGKRPPSTQFRSSNVVNVEAPIVTPPLTPTNNIVTETIAVPTGPATTSFPAESLERSATQQLSPNAVNRQQEIQSVVKEVDSIVTTVNTAANKVSSSNTMGQKSSRNHSSGSTHSTFHVPGPTLAIETTENVSEAITRAEFNEFRAEILRRLAKLEEKILDMSGATNDRQQHF